ncbi:RagB/SusD family nutrient uptake outer membrane protein [Bacteroides xylanisolvens]|uniref:RagB/SusD family nutrient uptake outer membrane protein n=1 Tax=Bacteroides xylanisolvens TaxID=371601 RepID=UPI00374F39A5
MKIKRLYLLGIGLMFTSQFLTSCHDLLEKDPTDSYSETVAWSSESSLDMYVTYLYKPLNGLSNFSSLSLTDGYTDLVKYGNGVPQTWSAHNKILLQQNTITSDNNPMSSWGLYTDIFRENVFLRDAGIYGNKFSEDFLNIRIAEIRFIRAVNYARMIRIFGGVILRDETNGVDSEGQKDKARATEAESWDFVLKDLEFAARHLPKEWDSKWDGRLTKGAAYAYMCRTALFAKRWDIAITAADEIKKLNKYDLMDNYEDVFKVAGNKEIIFSIAYKIPDMPHYFDRYFAPDGKQGIRRAVPTSELVDSYDMADGTPFSWSGSMANDPYVGREPRFYASIIYNGATWKEKKIYTYVDAENGFAAYRDNMNPGEKQTVTGYFIRKYLQENNADFDDKGSDQFWIEMRYAEVLLNLAEALAEQDYSKNQDDALEALNEVRERVNLPKRTTEEAPDKDSFMKLLRKERICELAFEGFRYWDLRRWRLAGEVIDGKQAHGTKITKKDDNTYTYEQVSCDDNINRFFPERYYLLPIPVDELQNNPLCENNAPW